VLQLQTTPCRFALGRITPLHKDGPTCQASNSCPTLLNSDYYVLARMLAERFGKVMPTCRCGANGLPALPGREIGDDVFHGQLVATSCPCLGSVESWPCWMLLRLSAQLTVLFS
jgi:hypothetical protein